MTILVVAARRNSLSGSVSIALATASILWSTATHAADTSYTWDARPSTDLLSGSTDSGTVDGITVTTSAVGVGSGDENGDREIEIKPSNTSNTVTGYILSEMNAETDDGSVSNTITFVFSEPVFDLSFQITDIDGTADGRFRDQVTLGSNNGAPSAVVGAALSYNAVTGVALPTEFCGTDDEPVPSCQLTATYSNPVTTVTIVHVGADAEGPGEDNPSRQVILIDDFSFNTPPVATDNTNTLDEDATVSGNLITDDDGDGLESDRQDAIGLLTIKSVNGTPILPGGTTIVLGNGASLQVFPGGNYTYNPNNAHDGLTTGQTATETFTFIVQDAENLSLANGTATDSEATLTLTITGNADPAFTVAKVVDTASVSSLPQTLGYTITVNNTGDTTLTGISLVDILTQNGVNTGMVLDGPTGDANSNSQLEVSETWTYSSSHSVTQAQMDDANDLVNNVSVTTNETGGAAQTASATTSIVANPSMVLVKTASETSEVAAGTDITYTYVVTNNGNQTISNISIVDVHNGSGPPPSPGGEALTADNGNLADSTDTISDNGVWSSLAPLDEITFTGTYNVTQNDVDTLQ